VQRRRQGNFGRLHVGVALSVWSATVALLFAAAASRVAADEPLPPPRSTPPRFRCRPWPSRSMRRRCDWRTWKQSPCARSYLGPGCRDDRPRAWGVRQVGLYPNPQAGYLRNDSSGSGGTRSEGIFVSQEIVTAGKLGRAQAVEFQEIRRCKPNTRRNASACSAT